MAAWIACFIIKHQRLLMILSFLSLIVPISQLPKARVNNSVEMWLSPKQSSFDSYRSFLKRYGTEQFIVVATRWQDPLSDHSLAEQVKIAKQIQQIPGVENVFDFGTIACLIRDSQSSFSDMIYKVGRKDNSNQNQFTTAKANEVLGILYTLMLLDVTYDDIEAVRENISKAYIAFEEEVASLYLRLSLEDIFTKSAINAFVNISGNVFASYHNYISELKKLDIDRYASFIGMNQQGWKTFVKTDPLLNNFILGEDGHTVGMILMLNNSIPAGRTVDQLNDVIDASGLEPENVYLAGTPVINVEFDRSSKSVSIKYLPMAIGFGTIALIVMIRNVTGCIAITATLISSMLWTIGILFLSGRSFNMVTITLPALLINLALAGNIHMVTHYLSLFARGKSNQEALKLTVETLLFPVFMTSLTTAVGFSSVMISDIKPIQDFGMFAAIGILISGLFNFIMLPGLLSFNKVIPSVVKYNNSHWTNKFTALLPYPRIIICVSIILMMAGGALTMKTQASSDTISFLPANSKVTQDFFTISNKLTGLYSIEVNIDSSYNNRIAVINAMEELENELGTNPLITKIIYTGKFKSFISRLGMPTLLAIGDRTVNHDAYIMLQRYHTQDMNGGHWRFSIFTKAHGSQQCIGLQRQIEDKLHLLDPIASYSVTGLVPLLNASQNAIIYTQIRSFSIAIIIILLLIGICMGSFRAMVAAILPNALPIVTLFSCMALLDIKLDIATVMIAGIATGIAADDTIHFLSCYRSTRKSQSNSRNAFIATFSQTGRSITWTSIIASCGFMILLLAPFKPLQYFGLLGSITMVVAWLCDIIVLPACINLLGLWEPEVVSD